MANWKKWLVAARYCATLPMRQQRNRRLAAEGQSPLMVLFYHRVADTFPNDWTISNQLFQRQIEWIRRRFDVISLQELQDRIRAKENHRPAVAITFDDGYAENCDQALPYLLENQIPFTYFVTLDNMLTGQSFPHDAQANCPAKPNTLEQIQLLAQAGVEIGGHTNTHPDVGAIQDEATLQDEVFDAITQLEDYINKKVSYFAFPYGLPQNLHASVYRMAQQAGLKGVCSAYGDYNSVNQDPFHIRRIHADAEMVRLKNWLTFDSRKPFVPTIFDELERTSVNEHLLAESDFHVV
ncbi:MAG: polysaccharide deacetylase family protein [Planctomycetales bacterium]|nr:polysaccharide deacetylase family protein [Planctomycetales bacterium]